MYQIKVNGKFDFKVSTEKGTWKVNDEVAQLDKLKVKEGTFHVLHQQHSYQIEVVSFSKADKTASIKVNGHLYQVDIKDRYDDLLKQLGLDNLNSHKVADLKAPMPGLVLNVFVKEGDTVAKGDNLFVLEAMKMENIIKSPADVTVKSVKIQSGDKVEKNQVLMIFA
jgi:biotin carboxyl carrier protein